MDFNLEVAAEGWRWGTGKEKLRMMTGHLFHAEVLAVWQGMPMGIVHFEDKVGMRPSWCRQPQNWSRNSMALVMLVWPPA